jgi:excisionase family DNA binding protein
MASSAPREHALLRLCAGLFMFGVLIGPFTVATADEPSSSAQDVLTLSEAAGLLRVSAEELERLAVRGEVPARRIGASWRFNLATLMAWLNGDWHLITAVEPPDASEQSSPELAQPTLPITTPSLTSKEISQVTGAGTKLAQAPTEQQEEDQPAPEGDEEPIGEAPQESTAEAVFLRGQKVLLAPGEVTMDVGFFFSRSDNQQLANVGGGVGFATIEQETFTAFVLGRVGVFNETELFASTTYRNENIDAFVGSTKISESDRTEFGDVRLGVRHTLLKEGPGRPNIIATLDGRIPTGDTSYAVGGGLAFVKSIDPVVLFANANYRYTFSEDYSDVTLLEPEDRFDVSMGYALSLNDTLTISTSVSAVFSSATSFGNATLRQQDGYSVSFALTSWLAKGLYIEPTVSIGLSGPGNSAAFGITLPYTF